MKSATLRLGPKLPSEEDPDPKDSPKKDRVQGAPGPEFFKSGRDRGPIKSREHRSTKAGSEAVTAIVKDSSEGQSVTAVEAETHAGSTDPAGEGNPIEGESVPPSSAVDVKEEAKRKSQEIKWLKMLDAGWYPVQTRDELKMYLHSPDSDSKTLTFPFDKAVFDWWKDHLTEVGRAAMEGTLKQKDVEEMKTSGTTLLGYMTTKAVKEIPLVKNQIGKMSFMQQSIYDLGWMAFLKMSKAPGLLPEKLWTTTLSDDPGTDQAQAARETFAYTFEKGFDHLISGLDHANAIAALEGDLNLESARLLKEKENSKTAWKTAAYYENRLKVAVSCMPATVMQEYFNRTLVLGLVEATDRSSLVSAGGRSPSSSSNGVTGPQAVSSEGD